MENFSTLTKRSDQFCEQLQLHHTLEQLETRKFYFLEKNIRTLQVGNDGTL